MTSPKEDWETLCAIYDDSEFGETSSQDDRRVKLAVSSFPKGFCGTVYLTLSTSKIAFARLVRADGTYRYFTIAKSPILKLDLLYYASSATADSNGCALQNEDDDGQEPESSKGPSNLRLTWEYYPSEWPLIDKEKYRSALAKKCHAVLREEGSFSVCQFLEHEAISFYHENHNATEQFGADISDGFENDCKNNQAPVSNASNSWKTYVDDNHPDYLLVILPPEMEQLYYPTIGTLFHPRKEAARLEEAAEKTSAPKTGCKAPGTNTKKKDKVLATRIDTALNFGRHALLQNWKDLYLTRCPICLEESILYSDGVVLPYCRHYCCKDCFEMYIKFKVQDLKQHRTNPFVCPLESCKRELPMLFCKPFLSPENIIAAKAWYKDLKNPPAWSLDRCMLTRTCGAVGSIRRKKSAVSIDGSGKTVIEKNTTKTKDTAVSYLVFCDCCKKTWCELCLTRVYDDNNTKQKHTISTHSRQCNPKPILRFCQNYMDASEDIREKCRKKYPWITSYSQFCQHDGAALQYILDNGQRCPNCQTGVERTEGCFHMKCPACATHFCYECGTELFPPYYGTHHCWEEGDNSNDDLEGGEGNHGVIGTNGFNYEVDEQMAMALQWGGW